MHPERHGHLYAPNPDPNPNPNPDPDPNPNPNPNQVHHKQLVANVAMAAPLHRLDAALNGRLRRERTVLGYNFAALRMLKQLVEVRDATSTPRP